MLTDEQILPIVYYWAKVLSDKQHSFDELVNEAYVRTKRLNHPFLLHKWVKFVMIHAIKSPHTSFDESRRRKKDITSTLSDEELAHAFDSIEDKSFNKSEFDEMQEELKDVINKVCSDSDKKLIYARFWLNLPYQEIARDDVVFQTIYFRVQKILTRMKKEYEQRARRV